MSRSFARPGQAGTEPAPLLLERERELDEIEGTLNDARQGRGSVLLLRGVPGIGKTALLREARTRAATAGMTAVHARASELEAETAWGMARVLGAPAVRGDRAAQEHALYWWAVDRAEEGSLLLALDDAQWADLQTLRFLVALSHRLDDLTLALLVCAREDCDGERAELLDRLALARRQRGNRQAQVLRALAALTRGAGIVGIGVLVERVFIMDLAVAVAPVAAQRVHGPAAGDGHQPRIVRARGVIGLAHAMHGQQGFLHHVIQRVRRHPASARDAADQPDGIGQHPFIGLAVAGLRRRHPDRALAVGLFAGVRGSGWHRSHAGSMGVRIIKHGRRAGTELHRRSRAAIQNRVRRRPGAGYIAPRVGAM